MSRKCCGGRKKGIQLAILRHRIGAKVVASGLQCLDHETDEQWFHGCERFHLVGLTRTQNGEYVPLNRKSRIWHFTIVMLCGAVCIQKTWTTLQVFLYDELRMESFMCLILATVYNGTALMNLGIIMRPEETMDLLNSWSHISASLKQIDPSSKLHGMGNTSSLLRTVLAVFGTQWVALCLTFLTLAMGDLPVLLFTTFEVLGLLPGGVFPKWAWQAMFASLELLIVELFLLPTAFGSCCLYIGIGSLEFYLQKLRAINISSVTSRQRVERMYIQLELFNRIAQVWIRFYFPPWLLAFSCGVILGVFATIRYEEMPLVNRIFFAYGSWTIMLLLFWQSYDMLSVIQGSEDVLGNLWKHEVPYFRELTRANRVELMKRSKAMRPLSLPVGHSEFSSNLPISTWDEIINQLLFLLSL